MDSRRARNSNRRSPQAGHSGALSTWAVSTRRVQRSRCRSSPALGSRLPTRIWIPVAAWIAARAFGTDPRIPAWAQVGMPPGGGGSGNKQRRHGHRPEKMGMVIPWVARTAV